MSRRIFIIPIVTAMVGLFFSFLVSFSLYQSEKKAALYEMQKDIDGAALSFSRELNVSIDLLHIIQNQIWNDRTLNKFMFDHVAGKLSERLPYIDSIQWIEAVNVQNKMRNKNKISAQYNDYTNYQFALNNEKNIKPIKTQSHYFPITYTTEQSIDSKLQGLDLLSLDLMAKEIQRSWYQGIPIAIFDAELQKKLLVDHAFFIFFPIFSDSASTRQERIDQIRGLFLVSLDIVTMFESVLGETVKQPIKLSLQRYNSEDEVKTLHENTEGIVGKLMKKQKYTSEHFFFGGNEWQISSIPSAEYFSSRVTTFPYLIFILGSTIFALIAYLVYVLQFRALHIERRIASKTSQLREINHKLERMSRSDGLTGLFNRTYFDECLDAEMKRAQRDELPISILIIEIDNLKEYIHLNGRNAGDNTLRIVGLALVDILKRPSDMIARYDDAAFAAILPSTKDGSSIAQDCIETIRKLKIPFISGKEGEVITVSIGGVTMIEANKINSAKLSSYAQIALSKAVAQGRNRIQWIYSPEES